MNARSLRDYEYVFSSVTLKVVYIRSKRNIEKKRWSGNCLGSVRVDEDENQRCVYLHVIVKWVLIGALNICHHVFFSSSWGLVFGRVTITVARTSNM